MSRLTVARGDWESAAGNETSRGGPRANAKLTGYLYSIFRAPGSLKYSAKRWSLSL